MSEPLSSLRLEYQQALAEHIAEPGEGSLQKAYELGRAALNARLGILDVLRLHSESVAAIAPSRACGAGQQPFEAFLLEAMSPFEAARRGFHLAWDQLQQLNSALADRNEELATSNATLHAEIVVRQRAEDALRESKDHFFTLFRQASEMENSLRDLSARVLTAQEEERKRISRELHDEIAQALTAVNVAVNLLKQHAAGDKVLQRKVAEAESLLAQSLDMVHTFARSLRPSMLDHLGVHSALRAHIANFTKQTKLRVDLESHAELSRMDGPRGEVIFRVTQEALNNIVKHAHATQVRIRFFSDDTALSMEIADNGRGFALDEKLRDSGGRLGLLGMQERARLVNGTFSIESIAGRGTRVTVRIPFETAPSTNNLTTTTSSHEEDICTACR